MWLIEGKIEGRGFLKICLHGDGAKLVVGRDPQSDITFSCRQKVVSRKHAAFFISDSNALVVKDTSSFGTFIDGHKMKAKGEEELKVYCIPLMYLLIIYQF